MEKLRLKELDLENKSNQNNVITIISPHQDDAAFSLARFIATRNTKFSTVKIINCFTVTNYAPQIKSSEKKNISKIRSLEDRMFKAAIKGGNIKIINII